MHDPLNEKLSTQMDRKMGLVDYCSISVPTARLSKILDLPLFERLNYTWSWICSDSGLSVVRSERFVDIFIIIIIIIIIIDGLFKQFWQSSRWAEKSQI